MHHSTPSLLIADAKATESPNTEETRLRLLAYATAGRQWASAGFRIDLAVCHEPDASGLWRCSLATLVQAAGLHLRRSTYSLLDVDNAVTVLSTSL
jgi:hypothetical protein